MSAPLAAFLSWLTEQPNTSASPASPAENHREAEISQQNQGCITRLTCLTGKTIRYENLEEEGNKAELSLEEE
jgi:hypothetical protein